MFSAQMKGCLPKVFTKIFHFPLFTSFLRCGGRSFAHDAVRPFLQVLVFFFGEPHERAVLRMFHTLHGDGGVEVGEFLLVRSCGSTGIRSLLFTGFVLRLPAKPVPAVKLSLSFSW